MSFNQKKMVMELAPHEKPLTGAEVAALARMVRRGLVNWPSAGRTRAAEERDQKLARLAMRKVRELKGQGL